MAAFVPYLMPEVRRAQGWEICEVPDVAAFEKALHLRAFMKGGERRIGALFEGMWWDGTLGNLHVTKLSRRAQPPCDPRGRGPKGEEGKKEGRGKGKRRASSGPLFGQILGL